MSGREAFSCPRLLEGKRLLVFDFDGTLADTTPLHAEAFAQVLAGQAPGFRYAAVAGMKTREAIRASLAAAGRPAPAALVDALAAEKQRLGRELIGRRLECLPGVEAFLRWARPRHALALCSSASRATLQLALEKLGFAAWFSPIVCGDDVARGKPDPEGFLRVLEAAGCPAAEALAFEDSAAGVQAALAAGMSAVSVTPGLAGASFVPWTAWEASGIYATGGVA